MKLVIAALCAVLSGCALMESQQQPPPDVNEVLNRAYQGGPVKAVMDRHGAPLRQMATRDGAIYTWEQDRVMYFDTRPPANVHCQMDAYVTPDGTVSEISVNGQNGACVAFLR